MPVLPGLYTKKEKGAFLRVFGVYALLVMLSMAIVSPTRVNAGYDLQDGAVTVGLGAAIGAVIGTSTLPFYGDMGDHVENILLGAGAGALAGIGLAVYLLVNPNSSDSQGDRSGRQAAQSGLLMPTVDIDYNLRRTDNLELPGQWAHNSERASTERVSNGNGTGKAGAASDRNSNAQYRSYSQGQYGNNFGISSPRQMWAQWGPKAADWTVSLKLIRIRF